jgi:hypothetical protein
MNKPDQEKEKLNVFNVKQTTKRGMNTLYSIYSRYRGGCKMAQKIGNTIGIFAITTLPVLMGVAIYITIVFGG